MPKNPVKDRALRCAIKEIVMGERWKLTDQTGCVPAVRQSSVEALSPQANGRVASPTSGRTL